MIRLPCRRGGSPSSSSGDGVPGAANTITHLFLPAATCLACPKRAECTTSKPGGRTIAIHPQEELLVELRASVKTTDGRAVLRQRTPIEHTLAALQQLQGSRAQYRGVRKNCLDARRTATLLNLQELARQQRAA